MTVPEQNLEQNLDEILTLVGGVNEILSRTPEGAAIFEKIRNQEITADQAVQELLVIVKGHGLLPSLMEASKNITALVPGALEPSDRPLIMETSTGIPQLNPLYEAAISERASLDGDVPELRSGRLPRDGRPAIPVLTSSMDPVVVGFMLERASDEISARFEKAYSDHALKCNSIREATKRIAMEGGQSVELAVKNTENLLPEVPNGVVGYLAREIPAPISVSPPTPGELSQLTSDQRRNYGFKTLATTQGRVSVVPPMQKVILEYLSSVGWTVEPGSQDPSTWCVTAVWSANVWGADDLSEAFNFTQVAAKSLAHDINEKARDLLDVKDIMILEVSPYNGISDRQFGWVAKMGKKR